MKNDIHSLNRQQFSDFQETLYDYNASVLQKVLHNLLHADCCIRIAHPIGEMTGPEALFEQAYAPLASAWPDLERREYIRMAGPDHEGSHWVGSAGYYTGTFMQPWLDIPATGQLVTMRFHEFFRFEDKQIVEIQALWDIVDVMHQAHAWPLSPSLGREIHVPGPATNDGVIVGSRNTEHSDASCQHIVDMLNAMVKHPAQGGPEVMELERFWHPKLSWYGPSGIGTCRGVNGFRRWHQIPFLKAMPDRGQHTEGTHHHFFGDGDYVAVTGWPNMAQTLTGDGWLGIAPSGQKLYLRSLDFWRLENGLIRENWVLVDLLDAYRQLGVDVFERMRELYWRL